jgi:hypothetical protein
MGAPWCEGMTLQLLNSTLHIINRVDRQKSDGVRLFFIVDHGDMGVPWEHCWWRPGRTDRIGMASKSRINASPRRARLFPAPQLT